MHKEEFGSLEFESNNDNSWTVISPESGFTIGTITVDGRDRYFNPNAEYGSIVDFRLQEISDFIRIRVANSVAV